MQVEVIPNCWNNSSLECTNRQDTVHARVSLWLFASPSAHDNDKPLPHVNPTHTHMDQTDHTEQLCDTPYTPIKEPRFTQLNICMRDISPPPHLMV
jgi:hypothetical protein